MLNDLLKMMAVPSTLLLSMTVATLALADDTEMYSVSYAAGDTGKPKVLVIFDDSGSMSRLIDEAKPIYSASGTYVPKVPANRIYWSDSATPPSTSGSEADQWFPASKNGCGDSFTPLNEQGTFNASAALYWQTASGYWSGKKWKGTKAGWLKLSDNVNDPYTVDCSDDVKNTNPANASGIANAYPHKAVADDTANSGAYINPVSKSDANWNASGGSRRFYTSHYMNWYYDTTITPVPKSYLQTAKDVLTDLVTTNTSIDFGLAVFNDNTSTNDNGGRIVNRIIKNMTAAERTDLITTLNGFTAAGNTPLCETAWESYLYLTGGKLLYGASTDSKDKPLRDTKAEDPEGSGTYSSPLEQCANTYIIYMTDGEPTDDTAANSNVNKLTGKTDCRRSYSDADGSFTSCLAPLSEYMAAHDLDGDKANGSQTAPMATVGFNVGDAATDLLVDAATMTKPDGSPAYYFAKNAEDLTKAFNDVLLGILASESTFTSPAVAVDSFSRTESRDDVFFAMFEPASTSDWWGNLKKLKLEIVDGALSYVDANDALAIDSAGAIEDSALTFWSTTTDGGKVSAGGVGDLLKTRALTLRNIVTNTGTAGAMEPFNATKVTASAYGLPDTASLYALWEVSDATDLTNSINYGWGYDVEDIDGDGARNDTRPWIMADILHSMPLTVNYGELGSFTKTNPDLRIIVGTNDGLLHMFGNSDGIEDWAFFPKELGAVLTKRRKNSGETGKNVYGIDGSPVNYTIDANHDGTIKASDGDKAYVYFGLRRGGNLLYGLDITNPDSPAFLWSISPTVTGFSELGQTWSTPIVTKIPGYKDGSGKYKPVLIFGGGYDPAKDNHATLASAGQDSSGRGIFIVDAVTGALVWSVTPANNSATNMKVADLEHSFPAEVYTLDSNGDSLTDRIYAGDSAGNLWRVDMAGDARPTSSQTTWFMTKMFDTLEKNVARTKRTDRRFFNQPNVIRTNINGAPVDVVTIGSGDRTNPIAKDNPDDVNDPTVDDQFYMIRDPHTTMYRLALDPDDCAEEPYRDFRCYLPLRPSNLYDVTPNVIQQGSDEERIAAEASLKAANGWRLDLKANGEKNLSESRTIDGKVEFNTFAPEIDEVQGCGLAAGQARNYLINLLTGVPEQDCHGDGTATRTCNTGQTIEELPTLIITKDGDIYKTRAPKTGEGVTTEGEILYDSGSDMSGPYGSYWDRGDF